MSTMIDMTEVDMNKNNEDAGMPMIPTAISSNAFSPDFQAVDALSFLEANHPDDYADVLGNFPEIDKITFGDCSSWFDTEAMGVDEEWGSWLIDAIEETGRIFWEEGEPWAWVECSRDLADEYQEANDDWFA